MSRGYLLDTNVPSELIRPQPDPRVTQWLENDLQPWFGGRIVPVTEDIAERCGVLEGDCHLKGIGFNVLDGLIAATALENDLTIVTRNIGDFASLDVAILNPERSSFAEEW